MSVVVGVGYDAFLVGVGEPILENGSHDISAPWGEDLSSEWDTDDQECHQNETKVSKWKKVRKIFNHVQPFMQTYLNRTSHWIQLAGHQGNFKSGRKHGTILKKFCEREKIAFEGLMKDNEPLKEFVPHYYGVYKDEEGGEFIEIQDLLEHFDNPCIMDCKMGVRTYLEDELLKAKTKPKLRTDMYKKMCLIDITAPTTEEHDLKGVTQPRYMVWRETISSTATLGFRIEAMKRPDGTLSKDFKTTKRENEVQQAFFSFHQGNPALIRQFVERLNSLENALQKSNFFQNHEVIGSSLLFVHDSVKASVWMIDFAKTCPLPEDCPRICHDKQWVLGNHEDGYLIGLANLIKLFTYPQGNNDNCS